ncbi:hypothetical protein Tome1A_03320 [Lactococcus lactis subsp. lactis]|uniref:Uncharacterized protein n=1 Tax=Lactococcus lactis subsp. lactis bv. diacetylactis TaxID=44688 RepID=A0A8B3F6Z5_LACLL|nr:MULTISPECIES: hypothetical protein [Lactococcus]KST42677.1 hypothetical protein APG02_00135 [Lactococcus lactis subsp. lactis bv. diacetylactis]MCT3142748.1 hypothetical protein [Lactococcus lactis]MDM7519842.1 hypothetical protein [Lactococcus lactis]QNT19879.1 hypothetical protein D8K17_009800 [Lactococcus lactis subsp. lactis bv. diacetylactis]RKO32782.1 hypothetical protein D8M10_09990 [Lactococcus lactis subsp. lactis bv. diacetylactis]
MKNENFVQIPNKMFADTNNDEKLVYAILQYTQTVGHLDKDNRMTRTMIPLLISYLGWSKSKYSNKKVVTALNGLKEKGYVNFESTQDVFVVQIHNIDSQEEHILQVDWKSSGIKFSGFTKIKYSVIDSLLEGKNFTLYSYAEYRTMKNHQYRICYEEWGLVLGMTSRNAFTVIDNSEVIIRVSNGFDSDTNRRETNSYLTFDSVEDAKEVSLKPTYKAQSSKSVVKEQEPELVEADFDNFEEEELSLKPKVKKRNEITNKQITDIQDEVFGRTVHDKILKKITDPRVTTVEQIKELTDFKYPMSLENYNILTTTEDGYLIKRGEDKLTNKQWKKKYFSQLNSEIGRKKQSEREFSQEEIKNYIRYQYDEEDEKPRKERKKLGNDISKWL